jgi:hypothetical protein
METLERQRYERSNNPLRCISLTQRTANSAGSRLIFARISGFGNNPVKYTDPDGKDINSLFSYSQMGNSPWGNTSINRIATSVMINSGCAITGMANIFTSALNNRNGSGYHSRSLITPASLNKPGNFYNNTDDLDWSAAAASMGMTASRSEIGNSDAAIAKLLSAGMSTTDLFVLVQVPITTSMGESEHWVGVDGSLVDLYGDRQLWVKVSPTSNNDNASRLNNSNWRQGTDGSMYVNVLSVKGTVTVE